MQPNDIESRISLTAALQLQARVHDLDAIYILSDRGDVLSRVESPDAWLKFQGFLTPIFMQGVHSGLTAKFFQASLELKTQHLLSVISMTNRPR